MKLQNLFSELPGELPEELVESLLDTGAVRIERIVSNGHRSADDFWYDQEQDEWVILLNGRARIEFLNGEITELKPGDYLHIPAHKKHRVDWTDPSLATIWLAIHF